MKNSLFQLSLGVLFSVLMWVHQANASQTMLVEKQRFHIETFTTFNGNIIKDVQVGWESYGNLNAQKTNAILITHYFTGNSHAAGKYAHDDAQPGYWDAIIGPGKAIDTNKYFVISVDSLANTNAYDKNVITTGPASVNPETGQPYGLTFPVVTIRDFVNVQKAVLESLGIQQLHAVVGPSMGSMQAIDWAATYPDWVPRMISVIGVAQSDPWTVAALEHWATPIKLDAKWQSGNYAHDERPMDGLTASLALITQNALEPVFFDATAKGLNFSQLETAPLNDIRANHSIVYWLYNRARSRAVNMDPNHLLYLVRACQLFLAGHDESLIAGIKNIKAKTLFIPSSNDLLLMPQLAKEAHELALSQGLHSQYAELNGGLGHLDGVVGISAHANTISAFLNDHSE